jgi:adenylosuccinate lyase
LAEWFWPARAPRTDLKCVMTRGSAPQLCNQLTSKGLRIIHDPAMGDKGLTEMLLGRDDVMANIPESEIRRLTDATNYIGLSEAMVDRVLSGMEA